MTFRKFVRVHILARMKRITATREISQYLETSQKPRINIGCGRNLVAGWLNTDIYPFFGASWLDAAAPWPTPPNTFDACLCEHMIEHVPKPVGKNFISNIYDALRPGGCIRIVTPELEMLTRLITDPTAHESVDYLNRLSSLLGVRYTACDAVNAIFYGHKHRYIYSSAELADLLQQAGFVDLEFTRGGLYVAPVFKDVDGHPMVTDPRMNEIEAVAIEAKKPE